VDCRTEFASFRRILHGNRRSGGCGRDAVASIQRCSTTPMGNAGVREHAAPSTPRRSAPSARSHRRAARTLLRCTNGSAYGVDCPKRSVTRFWTTLGTAIATVRRGLPRGELRPRSTWCTACSPVPPRVIRAESRLTRSRSLGVGCIASARLLGAPPQTSDPSTTEPRPIRWPGLRSVCQAMPSACLVASLSARRRTVHPHSSQPYAFRQHEQPSQSQVQTGHPFAPPAAIRPPSRSGTCRGGALHSVMLGEQAMDTDAESLAMSLVSWVAPGARTAAGSSNNLTSVDRSHGIHGRSSGGPVDLLS
jgi:Protein of unknown function (DUF2694)